jgi:hypothetical protein
MRLNRHTLPCSAAIARRATTPPRGSIAGSLPRQYQLTPMKQQWVGDFPLLRLHSSGTRCHGSRSGTTGCEVTLGQFFACETIPGVPLGMRCWPNGAEPDDPSACQLHFTHHPMDSRMKRMRR